MLDQAENFGWREGTALRPIGPPQIMRERLILAGFLIVSALFLFLDARTTPVILWDESRNVVNALEMRRSGFGLVTTYGFQPDLWNTKPPLLIWLMAGSMAIFGPSEWAMRVPSALAALATLAIFSSFVRRVTGSLATAFIAAAMLLLSPGFFGEHGARTADYDAVLLLFVTGALQTLFFAVHRAHPQTRELLLAGGLLGLAAMTKSIAGWIPSLGPLIYLIATRRLGRVARHWPRYGLAVLAAILPVLIFYVTREASAPGYLAAVVHNDMGGRFSQSLIGKTTSHWFYTELLIGWFFAGPLLLIAPLALRGIRGKNRFLVIWSLYTAAAVLIIYSVASTRLVHYALPAFPWLSILAALTLRQLFERFVQQPLREGVRLRALAAAAVGTLLVGQLTARAMHWRYEAFPARQFYPQASYGLAFEHLMGMGIRQATVVDPGFDLEGTPGYAPLLRSYQLIWSEAGFVVHLRPTIADAHARALASCDPATAARLARKNRNLLSIPGCSAMVPDLRAN